MRVAALYDIHGNLPALESVLAELQHFTVDRIVVGGDVLSGPMHVECIERLRVLSMPMHYLMGHSDRGVIAARRAGCSAGAHASSRLSTTSGSRAGPRL